ncbi:hypothetical protein LSH36_8g01089 [Paralvinella palmiformis]|uniref:Uncharacterized protein n=1 Tax=Paralvinella palmiformis TaxID=53620 RepID=A0AAD9NIC1_9ANNE|nr:hypothetical protein LSH36_8g01089 [Paralvinella palmiformis]
MNIVYSNLVDDADGRIIVLTFGVREGALKWLDDTKCPYPMLLDTERKVYDLMGLGKSVLKMGGNLLLDSKGCVAYIHCSKSSTDRPPIDLILNILKDLKPIN